MYSEKHHQTGRTLLEIIAVIVLMGILTITGIALYRYGIGLHSANVVFEDVLTQGEHLRHKTGATNKSIWDSGVGGKTRSGLFMISGGYQTRGKTFSVTVKNVPMDDCILLKQKKWPTDQVARIKINQVEYAPDGIECDIVDNFDLTVVFWSNLATAGERTDGSVLAKLCSQGCSSVCQECGPSKVCVDKCNGHGSCIDDKCVCTDNYYGDSCETAPLECQNGGVWDSEFRHCACPGGYIGETCETEEG